MVFFHRTSTLGLKGRPLRWLVTACAVTGFSLFGYDQGLMSGILQGDQFIAEFPVLGTDDSGDSSPHNKHVSVLQGGVTASYEIGCLFGAVFCLMFGEKIGRKPLVMFGSCIIVIGTVISTSAFGPHWGLGQFVVGRVVTGVGNGMNTATIPVWQSEMSRPEIRGRLVNLEGSVVALGTMIAYWLDFGLSFVGSSVQWRLPVAVQIIFALGVFGFLFGLPESPRWMVAHGRPKDAAYIESRLRDLPIDDPEIVEVISTIQDDVDRIGSAMRFRELLRNGRGAYFNRMLIGSSTQFFQQFTGCNAAIYYSTVLFTYMNQGRVMSLIMGGVFATVYFLATLPSFWLIEHLGRRRLFMMGAIGQGISMIITMACLVDARTETRPNLFKGAAVGLYLFITFFGMSILGLPWVYPPEINPLRTRTAATAISTCTNWICNFAVVMFTPVFVNVNGEKGRYGAYLFFAIINLAWVPLIYFFYPETAGRSLEEIDIIFAKAYVEKKYPFQVAKSLPRLTRAELADEANRWGIGTNGAPRDEEEIDSSGKEEGKPEAELDSSANNSSTNVRDNRSSISELSA